MDAGYQFTDPAEGVTLNVTVPVLHLDAGVVLVMVGMVFMVAVDV